MLYNYKRRPTYAVKVGKCKIGGDNPILLQSMTNTSTNDVEGSVMQIKAIASKGGELVRLTTQGEREASSLQPIKETLRREGCLVPISADVHFNPKAAFKAAEFADKVRINPGNFVDAARTFRKLSYTDEEYAEEIKKIEDAFAPFVALCKKNGVAIRLGVNHGSLSDRIMSRYGDTAEGMVESVMEFVSICRKMDFNDVVISIKSSQTVMMVNTVKLLVERLDKERIAYPLHLGVTEAGDAEDGRIKSAVGIGALLAEGIGDTIRVSLSEPPENEIPVAAILRDYILARVFHPVIKQPAKDYIPKTRDFSDRIPGLKERIYSYRNDKTDDGVKFIRVDASTDSFDIDSSCVVLLFSKHVNPVGEMASWIDRFQERGKRNPIVLNIKYKDEAIDVLRIKSGADFGALLMNGYGSGIFIEDNNISDNDLARLELDILQASALRIYKTEYISCPSCGRTLFDLPDTLRKVKEATGHLKGLKIGVMGCIVNGPGEMAGADYGYVGAGPGKVSIYKGKELIKKNISTEEALPALLELIEKDKK